MKNIVAALMSLFFLSCSFLDQGRKMASFSLLNGNVIVLTSIGGGATAKDAIWISEKESNQNETVLIDRIDGFNYTYEVKFDQKNDTILMLSLKSKNGGYKPILFEINLNNRISPNDGYLGAKRLE